VSMTTPARAATAAMVVPRHPWSARMKQREPFAPPSASRSGVDPQVLAFSHSQLQPDSRRPKKREAASLTGDPRCGTSTRWDTRPFRVVKGGHMAASRARKPRAHATSTMVDSRRVKEVGEVSRRRRLAAGILVGPGLSMGQPAWSRYPAFPCSTVRWRGQPVAQTPRPDPGQPHHCPTDPPTHAVRWAASSDRP